ncbi:MAG: hypothetical protein KRP56_04185 [Candidatus Methanogranum gryphiswaldense]|nr:MAG: hypothetical protein KRP56_04185 [Candidatus Methanogranum sp. U3.2.1]
MDKNRIKLRYASNIPFNIRSKTNMPREKMSKQDKLDYFIIRRFPLFLIISVFLVILVIILTNSSTITQLVYAICLGFVFGFCMLGFCCCFMMDRGVTNYKVNILIFIIGPMLIGLVLFIAGEGFYPSVFLIKFFDIFGGNVSFISITVAVYSIFIAIYLVSIGVISVMVGYFRSYLYRIFRYIETSKKDDSKKKRFTYGMFRIPDIIDVEEVDLDPQMDDDKFNKELFFNVFMSLFLLGIVICSYIFLNPFFLTEMPLDEMLVIAVMLSLFLSTLVIPWSIMKSVGAYVKSQARPYYLWKGMKSRLYQGFFAITFIMMILMLSAYLGMDFSRILVTYIGYVLFMGLISAFTSYIYVNHFYTGFKNGIVTSYYERKYRNKN